MGRVWQMQGGLFWPKYKCAEGSGEKIHSFRITHHRIFTECLLCARHRSKHGGAAVSANPQTPVLMGGGGR